MKLIVSILLLTSLYSCSLFDSDSRPTIEKIETIVFNGSESEPLYGYLNDSIVTSFTYSFHISQSEVSQKSFKSLMGYNPIVDFYSHLRNDSLPIVFVTYYDMILFCNKLSLQDGFDTVYSYTSISKDVNGQAIGGEGVNVDYSKNGYRLPTEAEWEYAARQGNNNFNFSWGNDSALADKYSWFAGNSYETIHKTCTKDLSTNPICDMSGNVLEMVEDPYYHYIGIDSVTNFVGAIVNDQGQSRVVKGGSITSPHHALSISSRKDTYAIYSVSKLHYLGFRIARGSILNQQRLTANGLNNSTISPIKSIATRDDVRNFFGSTEVKLTLINAITGNLVTLDYSDYKANINEWYDLPAMHPMISPNGRSITWGNVFEGQTKNGNIFISSFSNPYANTMIEGTGAIPRFYIDKNADTLLLFTNSAAPNSDSLLWTQGKSHSIQVCGSSPCNSIIDTWYDKGSFHDGISDDHNFAITAYQNLQILNLNTQIVTHAFQSPLNGKSASASSQACNASIGGDSNWVLFLDFGSTEKSTVIGKPYGIHEYLFLLDPKTGKIRDTVKVPSPWKGWNHVEWSTNKRFAIATVTDASEQNRAVYAIRFPDHATLKLVEGDDILTPHLWVYNSSYLNSQFLDSLFQYNKPNTTYNNVLSLQILKALYNRASISTLAIGSSRTLGGVNPQYFPKPDSTQNISSDALDNWTTLTIIDKYSHLFPKLNNVLIELSYDFLVRDSLEILEPALLASNGYKFDLSNSFWPDGLSDLHHSILLERKDTHPLAFHFKNPNGYLPGPNVSWGTSTPFQNILTPKDPNQWKRTLNFLFSKVSKLLKSGKRVVIYVTPQSPYYKDLKLMGKFGTSLDLGKEMSDTLHSFIKKNVGVAFLDEHNFGNHTYPNDHAINEDHLSDLGAIRFSSKLVEVLDTLSMPPIK